MKVGDTVNTWFNKEAEILKITPYIGRYPKLFKNVLRVSAPRTSRGWMEILEPL